MDLISRELIPETKWHNPNKNSSIVKSLNIYTKHSSQSILCIFKMLSLCFLYKETHFERTFAFFFFFLIKVNTFLFYFNFFKVVWVAFIFFFIYFLLYWFWPLLLSKTILIKIWFRAWTCLQIHCFSAEKKSHSFIIYTVALTVILNEEMLKILEAMKPVSTCH